MQPAVCGALACVLFAPKAIAQQQHVLRSGVQEVLVDVIVRDKAGRPIRDLRPEEVSA